jgi:hypothetical protein
MKKIIYIVVLIAAALPTLAQGRMRPDIDQDIPLAQAVEQANRDFPDAQPLTEDEVVAAVRAIKLQDSQISDAFYKVYQRVVNERVLPKGMYFSRIPAWHTRYGHFEVDWKDLTLDADRAGIKGLRPGAGYNYRIRARFISSRPLTEREAKEMRERNRLPPPDDNDQ